MQGTRCAQCHEEHRGLHSLVIRENALCVKCHRSLSVTAPKTAIRDVRGFPDGHPQFRVTLVSDAAKKSVEKVDLGADPKPADHPGLVFSHAAHLDVQKMRGTGHDPLDCANCHVKEPSGQGFLAITYEGQCQRCHALKFDPELPQIQHGSDDGIEKVVEGFYAARAIERGVPTPSGPEIERRVPGAVAVPSEPPGRLAWVRQQTTGALEVIYDKRRGCFQCHISDPARGQYRVAPVLMLTRFLAPAVFDHTKHAPIVCGDCHDARHSQVSSNVLIPGRENCVTCHGSETSSFNVQSTCTTCHVFHRQELGPIRQVNTVAK
ncbi:MAG: cytochrome c3 family protein [Alphaproteobacteria bacterium]|nr:cytochrome c3 family protein [Alphaproteobacteria bacterium]